MEAGARLPTVAPGGESIRPSLVKILRVDSGQLRVFFNGGRGIYSAVSSDDGLTWSVETGVRIPSSESVTGLSVMRTSSGLWRGYYSNATNTMSATSTDLLNWTLEGVRIGPSTAIGCVAQHPTVLVNTDGSVSLFYWRPSSPTCGQFGTWFSTSPDGLTFTAETSTGLGSSADPDVVKLSNGTLRMYYNNGNDTGGTISSATSAARAAARFVAPILAPPQALPTSLVRGGILR